MPARPERIANLERFATDLAAFLRSLQAVAAPDDGPAPGPDTFHRGAGLAIYDEQARQAIDVLAPRLGRRTANALSAWGAALASEPPVRLAWVRGDISVGNLLVNDGQLCGVIDFGQFRVGDPACDLAIAWTPFDEERRFIFRSALALDRGTWLRGRAWALWKALVVAAGLTRTNAWEGTRCWNMNRRRTRRAKLRSGLTGCCFIHPASVGLTSVDGTNAPQKEKRRPVRTGRRSFSSPRRRYGV